MKKGFLFEPALLLMMVVAALGTLNGLQQTHWTESENNRAAYDLSTQWQHLRFLLEQNTVNQIIPQITMPACDQTSFSIGYSAALNEFHLKHPNIQCSTNFTSFPVLQNQVPFSFDLSCTLAQNGPTIIFSNQVTFLKEKGTWFCR